MMRSYLLAILGLLLAASGGGLGLMQAEGEELKLDRAKALQQLQAIEEKNGKLTHDVLQKAARDFAEAGQEKSKAVALYLESYRNAEFGRSQEGDSQFSAWKKENSDKLDLPSFSSGAQRHVQYLSLVCRQALGEKEKPAEAEWLGYYEALAAVKDLPEAPLEMAEKTPEKAGDKKSGKKGARKTGRDGDELGLEKIVLESPLVRDRQIAGFLEGTKEAEVASGSLEGLFRKVVRPHLLAVKSRELLRLWDQRIARFDEAAEKKVKDLGADDYKNLKRPELLWERASDQGALGEEAASWKEKMAILQTFPYHPKVGEWIEEMKTRLGQESSALPEKGR